MNDTPSAFPADRCPLCGKPNRCAMEEARLSGAPQGPCWCTQVDLSAELLAQVPSQAKGMACICPACARPREAH